MPDVVRLLFRESECEREREREREMGGGRVRGERDREREGTTKALTLNPAQRGYLCADSITIRQQLIGL